MSPELIISIIAASTALIAVIVGPIISLKIAKKQMDAQKEVAERERFVKTIYIEEKRHWELLRETTADFSSKYFQLMRARVFLKGDHTSADTEMFANLQSNVLFLSDKIRLLLDHTDEFQRETWGHILEAVNFILSYEISNDFVRECGKRKDVIINMTAALLMTKFNELKKKL